MGERIGSDGDSVCGFFRADHERLDRALDQFCRARRDDLPLAPAALEEFTSSLERHFGWEEKVLFAVFEAAEPAATSGPTAVMRADHRKIEEALRKLGDRVLARDPACDEEEARLLELLEAHHFKEERVVYPIVDRILNATSRKELLRRFAEPPEADRMLVTSNLRSPK